MSKLSDYYSALDSIAPGWDKAKHERAVADAKSCAQGSKGGGSIDRMKSFITCMKGKKQYAT